MPWANRHETAIERSLSRAYDRLERLQRRRLGEPASRECAADAMTQVTVTIDRAALERQHSITCLPMGRMCILNVYTFIGD